MAKKWEIVNKFQISNLKFKIDDIVNILLSNRGIKTKKERLEFFSPTHPDKLKAKDFGINPQELKKTILRIKAAKKSGEKVIVWGDYDADGICGAAILWESLYAIGVNALPFIPERRTEGYGLNIQRMKQLKVEDSTVGLIITVDNGIVAHEKIDTARELGIDVIITDHHLPRKTKPKAYSILHTTAISGAGVAYLLAREIRNSKFEIRNDWLGLVALATISDMIPLVGPARSLVYHGIPVLQKTKREGIVQLCQVAAVKQDEIGTYEIGFVIAPRLNAMGRLESAFESLRLLCTKSKDKALAIAQNLNKTNFARQQMVLETVTHAREVVMSGAKSGIIFVANETYHEGIVGLVASRLVEEFGRPALVVSKGEEFSRGSARSIPGFNIVGLFDYVREYLVEGGGHPMAAGFTVRTENLEVLSTALRKHADGNLTKELLEPKIRIDCEISFSVLDLELGEQLSKFAPFGVGNPEPVFATRGVIVQNARLVGNGNKHLKLSLSQEPNSPGAQRPISAIAFGMGELYSKLSPHKPIDIAYVAGINKWNGNKNLELKVRDIKFD